MSFFFLLFLPSQTSRFLLCAVSFWELFVCAPDPERCTFIQEENVLVHTAAGSAASAFWNLRVILSSMQEKRDREAAPPHPLGLFFLVSQQLLQCEGDVCQRLHPGTAKVLALLQPLLRERLPDSEDLEGVGSHCVQHFQAWTERVCLWSLSS